MAPHPRPRLVHPASWRYAVRQPAFLKFAVQPRGKRILDVLGGAQHGLTYQRKVFDLMNTSTSQNNLLGDDEMLKYLHTGVDGH